MANIRVWRWLAGVLGLKRKLSGANAGGRLDTTAAAGSIIIDLQPQRPVPLPVRGYALRRATRHWRVEASEMSRRLSSHF